jgi:hypothetical protein
MLSSGASKKRGAARPPPLAVVIDYGKLKRLSPGES